jgi:hypothetical protein
LQGLIAAENGSIYSQNVKQSGFIKQFNFMKGGFVMEIWLPVIIQLISGAVGGNAAGAAMKDQSLGTIGNSIAGIIGGGIGGQLLPLLLPLLGVATGAGGMDTTAVAGSVASGGVGGGALMAIAGAIKQAMSKKE